MNEPGVYVLASIKPRFCWMILKGKKKWELRTSYPKLDPPFRCYIYCTLSGSKEFFVRDLKCDQAEWFRDKWYLEKGMVIAEFICDRIETAVANGDACCMSIIAESGLTRDEVLHYGNGKTVYAWHISNLTKYDKPFPVQALLRNGYTNYGVTLERAPQSWCYTGGPCANER